MSDEKYDFQVVGQQIVCGEQVRLPPICVFTGSTDGLVEVEDCVCFAPPAARALRLVAGRLVSMLAMKDCELTYFVAREYQTQRRKKVLTAISIGLIGFVGVLVSWYSSSDLLGACSVLLMAGGILMGMLMPEGLVATGYRARQFTIKGFHADTIEELRRVTGAPAEGDI